jgi:hypothetical protein
MVLNKFIRNSLLFLTAFAFIITASCKKYPDGPLLSLHSKEHRVGGTWDVEYFSINGSDSTNYLRSKYFYGMYDFVTTHNSDDCYYRSTTLGYSTYGKWMLLNNNRDLQVGFDFYDSLHTEHVGPYRAENAMWEIRRLTEKEMWLKNTYSDGREYLVKFKLFKNEP